MVGVPTLSPRILESILVGQLASAPSRIPFRVIRTEGLHGLVAVSHRDAPAARVAWNGRSDRSPVTVRTLRSYGTLLKGKAWIARRRRTLGDTNPPDRRADAH
ncbi:MAG: hypothetical protein L3K08_05530 [Thermoplasmata archaeon]|nr:hypothetical protein [Thermoplasmata archaeon]